MEKGRVLLILKSRASVLFTVDILNEFFLVLYI